MKMAMKRCAIGLSLSLSGNDLTNELIIVAVCALMEPLDDANWPSQISSIFKTFSLSRPTLRREQISEVNSPQCSRRFEECFSIRAFKIIRAYFQDIIQIYILAVGQDIKNRPTDYVRKRCSEQFFNRYYLSKQFPEHLSGKKFEKDANVCCDENLTSSSLSAKLVKTSMRISSSKMT